jgi:hypothetical protein
MASGTADLRVTTTVAISTPMTGRVIAEFTPLARSTERLAMTTKRIATSTRSPTPHIAESRTWQRTPLVRRRFAHDEHARDGGCGVTVRE